MTKEPVKTAKGERIAKVLARAGVCSRREAERWIGDGRVAVDGKVLTSPARNVVPGETVTVDGKPLPQADRTRLWRYHKPTGLVTTNRDPQGRPTVFDRLDPRLPRVMSVGRLDLNSEGLLLLTNDGGLARILELPSTGWTRRYRVRVFGSVNEDRLGELEKGVTVSGIRYGPIRARLDRRQGRNAWLSVSLQEGRTREVRKVMEHMELTVNRLIRVAYGPFQIGRLERGEVAEVPPKTLREQLERIGGEKRKAAGKDESSPERKPPRAGWAKKKDTGKPGRNKKTRKTSKAGMASKADRTSKAGKTRTGRK